MRADARSIAAALTFGATVAGIAFGALAIARLAAFGRRLEAAPAPPHATPTISVLKPARGLEPELEANLRSFCEQDYPDFEVVFGVRDAEDAALETIRRVAAAFPDRTSVVVGDGTARHRNPKIANLAPMAARARGEIVLIADSDMRVTPAYLTSIAAAFDDPGVGAVTAIYRGEPQDRGLASQLGAMGISEQFAPSTLAAAAFEPLTYTFGATMAVRRTALAEIGGLAALGDRLADDFALGRLVAAAGHRVVLAAVVVENRVSETDLRALIAHELRWARTIRSARPLSYVGILVTYPVPLAALHLALARNKRRAFVLLAAACAVRLGVHARAHRVLRTRTRPPAALIPLRDALGAGVWLAGLAGSHVRWRDETLHAH